MGVKILSLYDGMACGMIAMQLAGVDVESYDAYEIDKYAIKTAQHNFPMIKEHGDVFGADFTQYEGADFLVGGSPCTYWSIAQTKNRETVASGMGWELFSQYVRALHEAKPKYFIYENNKSMSKQIRASIDKAFGFEAVLINSALVSAQNRQRLYWVGRRNEDGTYSKVNVDQPADRGIMLKDILDNAAGMGGGNHIYYANSIAEPINDICQVGAKTGLYAEHLEFAQLSDEYYKGCANGNLVGMIENDGKYKNGKQPSQQYRVYSCEDKSVCVDTDSRTHYIIANDVDKKTGVAEPINVTADGKAQCLRATCYKDGIRNIIANDVDKKTGVAEPINDICQVGAMPRPDGEISTSAGFRIYSTEAEGRYLCANGGGAGAKTGLYAVPYDCDVVITENSIRCQRRDQKHSTVQGSHVNFTDGKTQTLSPSHIPNVIKRKDGKEITVYEVKDGKITIKGKQYPIKLKDGYYIIRKLTVSECKRLQTVPEWYEFPVSNSQAYKMLGNGWTCEVIVLLIRSCIGG